MDITGLIQSASITRSHQVQKQDRLWDFTITKETKQKG